MGRDADHVSSGAFRFELIADGRPFTGTWGSGNATDGGAWHGTHR